VLVSFAYVLACRVPEFIVLLVRGNRSKELEIENSRERKVSEGDQHRPILPPPPALAFDSSSRPRRFFRTRFRRF